MVEADDRVPERSIYLSVSQLYNLRRACRPIWESYGNVFLVGSVLKRPNFRDVDIRCMIEDEVYYAMFPQSKGVRDSKGGGNEFLHPRLLLLNVSISSWLASVMASKLEIDFQFQRMSHANDVYGADHHTRVPIGLRYLTVEEEDARK